MGTLWACLAHRGSLPTRPHGTWSVRRAAPVNCELALHEHAGAAVLLRSVAAGVATPMCKMGVHCYSCVASGNPGECKGDIALPPRFRGIHVPCESAWP